MTVPRVRLLLEALDDAEQRVAAAHDALDKAQTVFDIEGAKLAALRDEVVPFFWPGSPYLAPPEDWGSKRLDRGRYRYLRMAPSQAIAFALLEADHPLTILEIREAIVSGGGGGPTIDARALNAALQGLVNQGEIHRWESDDEKQLPAYSLPEEEEEEEVDKDDLPF